MRNLIRRNNRRDMLSQLHEDFNRLLTPFDIRATLDWPEETLGQWVPSIDVKEEKDHYLIHADVPGVKPSDIEVNMENGVLTIKGKRKTESKEEKENYLRIERSSGSFMRQITFPDAIDTDKIDAKCKDGVLDVVLPKASNGSTHKVNVKEG